MRSPASLPNLALLEQPMTAVDGQINPYYVAQPAPLGLADFGLGVTPYAYNTSHVDGSVTLTAPPNVTQPGAVGLIESSAGGQHDGYVGSENEFGVQLNTVGINLTIPGTYDPTTNNWSGYVWAQNVVNWNDTGIHFVQDTWNMSLGSGFYFPQNSIYSACGENTAGVNTILYVYGGIVQCVGGTIPITPSDYPITLSLYDNFTTNAQNRSVLNYGYAVYLGGVGQFLSGVIDSVVFNAQAIPLAPSNSPGNTIDGFTPSPTGLANDAEIVLVGGIGGDNGVFSSIAGSMSLTYSNASSGGWKSVPSAYNFGTDTGETSTGIADYWTPQHVLEINQGPSMLYGLWNAQPQVAVSSGDVQIAGTITPNYGFVFVSNTDPALNPNPFVSGIPSNLSWLPTNSAGAFDTYLPPLASPWTTTYYIQAFAAGSAETNTTVTAATTTLTITLAAASGTLRAPLYMSSEAQAAALNLAVGGSGTAPYLFKDLTVDMNLTFNHLNDYGYPSFEVFQSQGVTAAINVTSVYQGTDSSAGNYYFWDGVIGGPSGMLVPGPSILGPSDDYNSGINIFDGMNDAVYDMFIVGVPVYYEGVREIGYQGTSVTLWRDSNAHVNEIASLGNDYGVWVGDSFDTAVDNLLADDAVGVTDSGSTGTSVWDISVYDAEGVSALGSFDGTYSWINVTGGVGVEAGADYGPSTPYYYDLPGTVGLTVNHLNVTDGGLGANITFSQHTTLDNVSTYDTDYGGPGGIWLDGTWGTDVNSLVAYGDEAWGIDMWNATYTNITGYLLENSYDLGSYWDASSNTVVNGFTMVDYSAGIWIGYYGPGLTNTAFTNVQVSDVESGVIAYYSATLSFTTTLIGEAYLGIGLVGCTAVSFTNLNVTGPIEENYAGVLIYDSLGITLDGVVGYGATAIYGEYDASITGTGIVATDYIYDPGVWFGYSSSITLSDISASEDTIGVELDDCSGITVTGVTATSGSLGVLIDPSSDIVLTDVSGSDHGYGAIVEGSTTVTVTTVSASDEGLGVIVEDSSIVGISGVTVTGVAIGVSLYGSEFVTVAGVTATGTAVNPWTNYTVFYQPIAAIDTYGTTAVTISGVTATDFPAALYDDGSNGLTVSSLNATGGYYGVVLNDTYNSLFTGVGAYKDWQGMLLQDDAHENTVTLSSFVDDTSYGVAIVSGEGNTIWDNNFIADNGATGTYSPAHIQAFSGDYNDFYLCTNDDCTTGVGNYWADWHTYGSNGYLAPYLITGENYDYFPIGPQETFTVSFAESGLASGTSWTVTLNGVTMTSTTASVDFTEPMGTYSYQVGNVAGYTVSPTSGSVVLGASTYTVQVTYAAIPVPLYAVTLNAGGLASGTVWTATVNGVTQSTSGASLIFDLPAGSYPYTFNPVSGYSLGSDASGTVTVVNGPVSVGVPYTSTAVIPPATYAVTLSEGGLALGTVWSATVNGVTQSTSGTSLVFYLASGSYSYAFNAVSGYNVGTGASGTIAVNEAPTSLAVSYSPVSTPSYVQTSDFNNWLAVLIAVAVIALVIGLLALFLRRGKGGAQQQPQGAQAWTPPPAGGSGGSAGSGGSSSSTWSEGPSSGGSPPSS